MGKLMKFELRSLWRIFVPCWAAIILLGFINRALITMPGEGALLDLLRVTTIITHVMAMIAVSVVAIVFMLSRFYKGLLKESGYLMFTLPTSVPALIWSKAISAAIISLLTAAASGASIYLMLSGSLRSKLEEGFRLFTDQLSKGSHNLLIAIYVVYAFCILLVLFVSIFRFYMAMSIGQLANKRKIGLSVLSYLGISLAKSTLINTFAILYSRSSIRNLYQINDRILYWENSMSSDEFMLTAVLIILIIVTLTMAIEMLLYYLVTRSLLKRRLNLE